MVAFYSQEDQDIYEKNKFMPQSKYLLNAPTFNTPTETEKVTPSFGIPYTNAFTGSGGGGGGTGPTSDLIGDFNRTITDREAKLNAYDQNRGAIDVNPADAGFYMGEGKDIPRKRSFTQGITDFVYDKVPYINRPQSYKDIMTKGYQEPEGLGIPSLIGFLNKMGIQNFAGLPQADQAFIKSQSGYRGPTVFGENTAGGNVDPFKMNVESLFGNYAEGVKKDHTKLSGILGGKLAKKYSDKYGIEVKFNPITGKYESDEKDAQDFANKRTDSLRTRYGFRDKQINKQKNIKKELIQIDKDNALAGKSSPGDKARAGSSGRRPGSGGNVDRVTEGPGQNVSNVDNQAYDAGGREGYGYGLKKGGRAGYFFGGRVNYKAGGRTDAGPNRTTASHSTRGQINESGQQVSGGQTTRDNNNNDKPTFYSPPNKTNVLYDNTILGKFPTGLTKDMDIGKLSAIMDLNKTLEEEKLEGKMQFDSSIGPVNTTTTYDSVNGPEFNASYTGDNYGINYGTDTGLSANYSKDIGPGTFTMGGDINPDGTYNTQAKYGITFANGGLAGIL